MRYVQAQKYLWINCASFHASADHELLLNCSSLPRHRTLAWSLTRLSVFSSDVSTQASHVSPWGKSSGHISRFGKTAHSRPRKFPDLYCLSNPLWDGIAETTPALPDPKSNQSLPRRTPPRTCRSGLRILKPFLFPHISIRGSIEALTGSTETLIMLD